MVCSHERWCKCRFDLGVPISGSARFNAGAHDWPSPSQDSRRCGYEEPARHQLSSSAACYSGPRQHDYRQYSMYGSVILSSAASENASGLATASSSSRSARPKAAADVRSISGCSVPHGGRGSECVVLYSSYACSLCRLYAGRAEAQPTSLSVLAHVDQDFWPHASQHQQATNHGRLVCLARHLSFRSCRPSGASRGQRRPELSRSDLPRPTHLESCPDHAATSFCTWLIHLGPCAWPPARGRGFPPIYSLFAPFPIIVSRAGSRVYQPDRAALSLRWILLSSSFSSFYPSFFLEINLDHRLTLDLEVHLSFLLGSFQYYTTILDSTTAIY